MNPSNTWNVKLEAACKLSFQTKRFSVTYVNSILTLQLNPLADHFDKIVLTLIMKKL